jgi:hypothetical protein
MVRSTPIVSTQVAHGSGPGRHTGAQAGAAGLGSGTVEGNPRPGPEEATGVLDVSALPLSGPGASLPLGAAAALSVAVVSPVGRASPLQDAVNFSGGGMLALGPAAVCASASANAVAAAAAATVGMAALPAPGPVDSGAPHDTRALLGDQAALEGLARVSPFPGAGTRRSSLFAMDGSSLAPSVVAGPGPDSSLPVSGHNTLGIGPLSAAEEQVTGHPKLEDPAVGLLLHRTVNLLLAIKDVVEADKVHADPWGGWRAGREGGGGQQLLSLSAIPTCSFWSLTVLPPPPRLTTACVAAMYSGPTSAAVCWGR